MFTVVIVELTAVSQGRLQPGNALQVNGLFYNLIQEADQQYSEKLHNLDSIKPYTLSNLQWNGSDGGKNEIIKGNKYFFRATFMESKVFELFHRILMYYHTKELPIKIGELDFNIVNLQLLKMETLQDIMSNVPESSNFKIDFLSPTSFRKNGINWLFPDPTTVFKSLSVKWKALTNEDLYFSEKVLEEISNNVFSVKYELKTRLFHMGNYKMVGFIGSCDYEVKANILSKKAKNQLYYLLRLADYSGIGYKTTMGLGQVKITYKG